MSFIVGTALLAAVTALACALPGVLVVLQRRSMLVDAISHAVFPGIVVGYLFTRDLESPLLIIGAALAGLVVVMGSEWLGRTGLLVGDSPQGLVFPALFSVGVILVSANLTNVHLDTHVVLVGDLNLAAAQPLIVGGFDLGPRYLAVMVAVLAMNVVFLAALHPWLKVSTFDPAFAASLGLPTRVLSTAFMVIVSVTVTAAFHAAGAILVIALMVMPPATAFLLTRRLAVMFALTALIAVAGALAGFALAYAVDAATSAGMAVFYGLVFAAVLVGTRLARRVRHARSVAGVDPDGVGRGGPELHRLAAGLEEHTEGAGER